MKTMFDILRGGLMVSKRFDPYHSYHSMRAALAQSEPYTLWTGVLNIKAVELGDIVMADHPLIGLGTAARSTPR